MTTAADLEVAIVFHRASTYPSGNPTLQPKTLRGKGRPSPPGMGNNATYHRPRKPMYLHGNPILQPKPSGERDAHHPRVWVTTRRNTVRGSTCIYMATQLSLQWPRSSLTRGSRGDHRASLNKPTYLRGNQHCALPLKSTPVAPSP